MVSGSWGNEMTAHLNHFSPGGGRNRNWQVIHLRSAKAGGGGGDRLCDLHCDLVFVCAHHDGGVVSFSSRSVMVSEWPCLLLASGGAV